MLEDNYHERLKKMLLITERKVTLPVEWSDFFEKRDNVKPYHDERRRFARRYFRTECILELEQSILKIPRQHQYYRVFIKDPSRGGIGLLHSQQLFPGERALLWLPTSKISVCVARCYRHNSSCYDIGARFGGEEN